MQHNSRQKHKVLFILPYPVGKAPSQRFRVEQFLPLLSENNIAYKVAPFMSNATWDVLYKGNSFFQKGLGVVKGFLKRWKHIMWDAHFYDTVFIHREAAPLGPPVFEWILAKVLRKKVVYDFDDAIWIPNTSAQNKIASSIKAFWKIKKICKWAAITTAGNQFLQDFAIASGSRQSIIIPTVVDTITRYNAKKEADNLPLTIGWTGSHSTLKYLKQIVPLIQELQNTHDFIFIVIADKDPQLQLQNYRFIKWQEATEIADLLKIDIGVMPLEADKWAEGKCGFKLIQYLALGIPAIASSVGVNKKIINEGENGYLCETAKQWYGALNKLIEDKDIRESFSNKGILKVQQCYSLTSQKNKFLQLFRSK